MAPGLFLVKPSPLASMMWALPSARTKNRGLRATPSACGSCRAVAARSYVAKSHSECMLYTVAHISLPSNSHQVASCVGPQPGAATAQCT